MLDTEREYQALLNNAPVGIVYTKDKIITRHNIHFAKIFGFESSVINQPARLVFRSDADYAALGKLAGPALGSGQPFHHELELRHQDGRPIWVDAVAYLIDVEHPAAGTIWILADISERKLAESQRQETLLELQTIFDNASVGIAFMNRRTMLRCNRRFEEMTGYARGALHGVAAVALHESPEAYEDLARRSKAMLIAGKALETTTRLRKQDGTLIWCHLFGKAIDANDDSRGTVWIAEDISEAVSTRDALQKSSREMEALMANAPVGIAFTRDRKLQRYNQHFGDLFGFTADSAIGADSVVLYRSAEEFEALNRQAAPLPAPGQALPHRTVHAAPGRHRGLDQPDRLRCRCR